jgi:hypothetical protein
MQSNQVDEFLVKSIILLHEIYNKPVKKDLISFYHKNLIDIESSKLKFTFKEIALTFSHMPSIAEIRNIALKENESKDSIVNSLVHKIWYSVKRFGRYNEDDAMKYLDIKLWCLVEKFGGWQYFCDIDEFGKRKLTLLLEKEAVIMLHSKSNDTEITAEKHKQLTEMV